MSKTVKTIAIKGDVQYAKVATRLVEFRSDYPRGKTHVERRRTEDGNLETEAYIWKDGTELAKMLANGISFEVAKFSCDANGSASAKAAKVEQEKGYEKQETIALGRALAALGYATDGNVASDEEMEAYEQWKAEQAAIAVETACKALKAAKTIEDLHSVFVSLENAVRRSSEVIKVKDEMKAKLSEPTPKPKEEKKK